MLKKTFVTCLLLALAGVSQAADLVLPLERQNYFIGESIPLAVSGAGDKVDLKLVDARGTAVPLYAGKPQPVVWDTTLAAAGAYQVQVDGSNTTTITLRSPVRESAMSLIDESHGNPKLDMAAALADTGISAMFWPAFWEQGCKRNSALDQYAPSATLGFINPTTRPSSFFPPRVEPGELTGFRQRLAMYAAVNARYPTFGGFWYDWDGASMFEVKGLTRWFGLGKYLDAFRTWSDRRDQAVYDEFKRRTNLEGVRAAEFLRYCLASGRPEFGPYIDYYTYKLSREIAKSIPAMPAAEIAAFETRLDAWSHFLMHTWAEAYHGHQEFLREVIPSLRNTSSVNIDHGPVRLGHWDPAYTRELDFRYMSAWNDQMGSPDYSFQWLFTTAVLEIGRQPGQPIWLSSVLGATHGMAPYPGKFLRVAGHGLAYGQTGIGLACEGFSAMFAGGMTQAGYEMATNIPARWNDYTSGREFLKRFAALGNACAPWRRVAVLYSETQLGRQEVTQGMASPQFAAFMALARLGYTPHYITEEQIRGDELGPYGALVIVNQSEALPDAVLGKLVAFTGAGGKLILDQSSKITPTNATPVAVTLPYATLGAPHNWTVMNTPGGDTTAFHERRTAELMPKFYAALGDGLRAPLMSAQGAAAKASTFAMRGGADVTYVVAVNDFVYKTQADWVQFSESLIPNGVTNGALYDLTAEQALGAVAPVTCALTDLTVRVYGMLARPVAAIDLAATQRVKAGEALQLSVRFLDAAKQPLRGVIPFALTVTAPDGAPVADYFRSTDQQGTFSWTWTVPVNAPSGNWSVKVRSQLNGATAMLPVEIKPGGSLAAAPLTDTVVVRGLAPIEKLLATKPAFVLPLFDETQRGAAEAVKTALAQRGVAVEVRAQPAMTTFTVTYVPTPEQAAENDRVRRGEAIGTAVNDYEGYMSHYEGSASGFAFGKPVILLDVVGTNDNVLAEKLDTLGALWPKVSAAFPGHGRATVQLVKSPFAYETDALIIQAADLAGLQAGAAALVKLPADWIGESVATARTKLLAEFGIGVPIAYAAAPRGLTSKGLVAGQASQPFTLNVGDVKPPTPEEAQKPAAAVPPTPPKAVPGSILPNEFSAQYLIDGAFIPTVLPLPGDCRFFDALVVNVDVAAEGSYTLTLGGTFRYSDREPLGQGGWEAVMAMHKALKIPRGPMTVDVYVDGKPVGTIGTLTTAEQDVHTYAGTTETVKEELVTTITGQVPLPAGKHELKLVHHQMVDGTLKTVEFTKP